MGAASSTAVGADSGAAEGLAAGAGAGAEVVSAGMGSNTFSVYLGLYLWWSGGGSQQASSGGATREGVLAYSMMAE